MVTDVRALQPQAKFSGSEVTVVGMTSEVSAVQLSKTAAPSDVRPAGKEMETRLVQLWKAWFGNNFNFLSAISDSDDIPQ